jgi:hypothetical protein
MQSLQQAFVHRVIRRLNQDGVNPAKGTERRITVNDGTITPVDDLLGGKNPQTIEATASASFPYQLFVLERVIASDMAEYHLINGEITVPLLDQHTFTAVKS